MARIFTTQFTYNHQQYDAIVTVVPNDGVTTFNVRVLDSQLDEISPKSEFSYTVTDDFLTNNVHDEGSTDILMKSISTAIEEHLAAIK